MKLLAADPKPKSKPGPGPPTSASSTSTAVMEPARKRTRDLPDLFNCHCCGRRINRDNPRDRPQALDSVWRIVLLCKKCRKSIHSGETCSYCFRETRNSEDLCQCSVCECKIHKDCVTGYGDCSPWCYLGAGLEGFGVCVDCWVPELLKGSIKVCRRSENKRRRRVKSKAVVKHLLEKGLKDGECDSELVRIAKKQALKRMEKVVGLENGEGKKDKDGGKAENLNSLPRILSNCLENFGSLDVLSAGASNSLACEKSGLGKGVGEVEGADDSSSDAIEVHELANQPFRDMDCSSRTLSSCLVNFGSLDGLNAGVSNGIEKDIAEEQNRSGRLLLSYKRSRLRRKVVNGSNDMPERSSDVNGLCKNVNRLNVGLLSYKRDRNRKKWLLIDRNAVIRSPVMVTYKRERRRKKWQLNDESNVAFEANQDKIDVHADQSNLRTNADRLGQGPLCYKRSRFTIKACHLNGLIGVNGSCDDVNGLNPGLLTYKQDRNRKSWKLYDQCTELC